MSPAREAYCRAEKRAEQAMDRYYARPSPKLKAEMEAAQADFMRAWDVLEAAEPTLLYPFGPDEFGAR